MAARARLPRSTADIELPRRRGRRGRAAAADWEERRGALDFEIDGVVVKVDDLELQRRLGRGRARPALGDRLEVPADDARSRLLKDVAVERRASSATCIPFAELEPVQVGGVTVKLATLHNEEDLRPQGRPRRATR